MSLLKRGKSAWRIQIELPADPVTGARRRRYFTVNGNKKAAESAERKALYDLSIKGFKLPVDDSAGSEAEPITHSSRFALVDKDGQIRGYYSGTEEDDFQRLVNDARNNK